MRHNSSPCQEKGHALGGCGVGERARLVGPSMFELRRDRPRLKRQDPQCPPIPSDSIPSTTRCRGFLATGCPPCRYGLEGSKKSVRPLPSRFRAWRCLRSRYTSQASRSDPGRSWAGTDTSIRREHHVHAGYMRLRIFIQPRPHIAVEAKSDGWRFEFPYEEKHRTLKLLADSPYNSAIRSAIDQVRRYCDDGGIRYAVANNAPRGSYPRHPRDMPWRAGAARIFPISTTSSSTSLTSGTFVLLRRRGGRLRLRVGVRTVFHAISTG